MGLPERLFVESDDALQVAYTIADSDRLLVPDETTPLVYSFDLTTLQLSPLFTPVTSTRVLLATTEHIDIVADGNGAVHRTNKDGLEPEEVYPTGAFGSPEMQPPRSGPSSTKPSSTASLLHGSNASAEMPHVASIWPLERPSP